MMMMMMMMKEEGFDRERRSYCGCWIPRTHKNEEYCIYMGTKELWMTCLFGVKWVWPSLSREVPSTYTVRKKPSRTYKPADFTASTTENSARFPISRTMRKTLAIG
mmetsp:Transcript_3663/g.8297  ORF Transcript_3663/g.8297 Transcript_3663/m.8297 type:complete len:106 (-) Transcript_3663:230-547(-)